MKQYVVLLFISWYCVVEIKAQDPRFTMPYGVGMYTNPAFTGNDTIGRLQTGYRNQWPKLADGYISSYVGYSAYLTKMNASTGLFYTNDRAGHTATNTVSFVYAQNVKLGKNMFIRPAVNVSWFQKTIDVSQLVFGTMIDPQTGIVQTSTEEFLNSKQNIDINAGLLFYAKRFSFGFAYHHVNQPDVSLLVGGNSPLPSKFSVQLGYDFKMPVSAKHTLNIQPFFMYKTQGSAMTMMAGSNFMISNHIIVGGGWWKNDAIIFTGGYQNKLFRIQYAYDHTISDLGDLGGAHEIMLGFNFWKRPAHKNFIETHSVF